MSARETEAATLIGSVQRALRLVDIVANSARPIPVKALATATSLTPGTTYNLTRTLIHEGYLQAQPDGLILGPRFPSLYEGRDTRGVFLARVRSALNTITDEIGATAYLSRFDDGEVHLIDVVDAVHDPRVEFWVGMEGSAHATALGKQILSVVPEGERLDYLSRHPLAELTPRTVSDRRLLLAQLEHSKGWVVEQGEYSIGTTCLAVPVIAPGVTASLAISLREDRRPVDPEIIAKLQAAARTLAFELGATQL